MPSPSRQELRRHFVSTSTEILRRGGTQELAIWVGLLRVIGNIRGWPWPRITSVRRTPAQQEELRRRWEIGDPAVVYPPAQGSLHLTGQAIDLSRQLGEEVLAQYGYIWTIYFGFTWGGLFSVSPDVVHFDLRRSGTRV